MSVDEARKFIADGQFEAGTMLPKIEAAVEFLSRCPRSKVLITSLAAVHEATDGHTGTIITA